MAQAPPFGLAAYETHMRSWGASDDTVQARRILAARFLDGRHPREVTGTEVVEFLATPGFSGYTRRTYFCHLRSLFAWAIDAGLIEVSPMERVRRPRIPKSTPKPLTDAEVTLVLDSATGDLRAWLILSMFAGLRAHEIAKIRGEDVTDRELFVLGKGGKEAYLPTHPLVLEVAGRYPSKGYWFPSKRTDLGHIEGASITRAVGKHFKRHGIDGSVHRGRHLRHDAPAPRGEPAGRLRADAARVHRHDAALHRG